MRLPKASDWQRLVPRRKLTAALRWAALLFVSRRMVINLLLVIAALELTVLGVGLSRRMDMAYDRAERLSRETLAAVEARSLLGDGSTGAAGIGVPSEQEAQPEDGASSDEEGDDNAPPPLRPRDVDLIVAEEGGSDTPAATSGDKPAEGEEAKDVPSPTAGLSTEDSEELDLLIRKAVTAMTEGDMKLCILTLEEARGICPEHPAVLYYYGMAYDKLLNPVKARDCYTKVFRMRDAAGIYFQRASRRLTYGFEQPSTLRGKFSFGPYQLNHTQDNEQGEKVDILLPVLLAPGEEIRPEGIYIDIQFFDLANGRKIEFCRRKPELKWQNEKPDWKNWEEDLLVSYTIPPLTQEERDAYGDLRYYGFTAKLYYQGEPLDCLSSPPALILQEQRLNSRRANRGSGPRDGLLPDDGLDNSYEEAMPVSDFLNELTPSADKP